MREHISQADGQQTLWGCTGSGKIWYVFWTACCRLLQNGPTERFEWGAVKLNHEYGQIHLGRSWSEGHRFKIWCPQGLLTVKSSLKFVLFPWEPVLVAQSFKWSSSIGTLMNLLALGSCWDHWRERNSTCYKPSITEGQWLWCGENLFPSPSAHLSEGHGFKPHDHQKIGTKFNCTHEGMLPVFMLTFLPHFLPI